MGSRSRLRKVREALNPVLFWYQSDEAELRPTQDIVADVVSDLQMDRASSLLLNSILLETKKTRFSEIKKEYPGLALALERAQAHEDKTS
jgi:hypothetical protein